MSEPQKIVLLKDSHQNEFLQIKERTPEQLRKQLLTHKRNIKKLEESILVKRNELAALSNSLNKEVERQLTIKMHQESYLQIFKTANQKPALKDKLAEIVKTNNQIEQARGKLEEMRVVKDSGVNQRGQSMVAEDLQKAQTIARLTSEAATLKGQTAVLEEQLKEQTAVGTNLREFQADVDKLRKQIKQLEKQLHKADTDQIQYSQYSTYLLATIEATSPSKPVPADPHQFSSQVELLKAAISQKLAFEKKSTHDVWVKMKKIQQATEKNFELKKQLREFHNTLIREHLDVQVKKPSTQRLQEKAHSSDKLSFLKSKSRRKSATGIVSQTMTTPRYQKPKHTTLSLGDTKQSPTSMWVSDKQITDDKEARIQQITVYQTPKQQIAGIQIKYSKNGQVITGRKMLGYTAPTSQTHTLDIANINSLSILYDDNMIYAIKSTNHNGQTTTIGKEHPGISRVIQLSDTNLISIQVKLQPQETPNETIIVGMLITIDLKTILKKNMTVPNNYIEQDIQISDEPQMKPQRWKSTSSHKNIIHKGQLPKVNVKQIVDHRLLIGQSRFK